MFLIIKYDINCRIFIHACIIWKRFSFIPYQFLNEELVFIKWNFYISWDNHLLFFFILLICWTPWVISNSLLMCCRFCWLALWKYSQLCSSGILVYNFCNIFASLWNVMKSVFCLLYFLEDLKKDGCLFFFKLQVNPFTRLLM